MPIKSGDTCIIKCEWVHEMGDEMKNRRVRILYNRGDGFYLVEWLGRTKFLSSKPEEKYGTLFEESDLEVVK